MTSNRPAVADGHDGRPAPILSDDLAAALHAAVREAIGGLDAVAAAVYLLSEDGTELWAAMIGGGPPSVFTLPGRMALDTAYATALAFGSGAVAIMADPDHENDQHDATAYPFAVAAAPAIAGEHRFGALTVLRLETQDGYDDADRALLGEFGDRLAVTLAGLAEQGKGVGPGHMPVLVPVARGRPVAARSEAPGWGVPGIPGSAGMSLMYPLRRLGDLLNQATTMEHVVGAARFCVMSPFRAQALALASVGEGRLWVVGHSGDSSDLVRDLHGSGLHRGTPAARAVRGRPVFISVGSGPLAADAADADDGSRAGAYLPLIGSRHVIDLPCIRSEQVVGVCCLSFAGARRFSPEERAVLTTMAGMLGSAVERVELSRKRHALAEGIQKRLLPSTLSELPELTSTVRYLPATTAGEVGGDWYDVIKLQDERVVLVVGDVEGHGIESATVMGQLRSAVMAYATEGHRPAAIIDRTGRLLAQLGTELLATCCVVALDTMDGTAEVALAGHPEPLVRTPDGRVSTLDAPANVPLGVDPPTPYGAREHILAPGSVLLVFSDGLLDWSAPDPLHAASALFGSGAAQAETNLEDVADRLVVGMPGPHQRRDDAVLLLACYEGSGVCAPRTEYLHIQRHDLQGVKAARGFVHDRLRAWGLAEMTESLELITSEVVTNSLIHAGSDVDVRLRAFEDRVRLEVRDSDTDPPVPSPFSLSEEGCCQAEHGRGLFLVDALASAWNSSPNGRGKTVWAELAIAPSR